MKQQWSGCKNGVDGIMKKRGQHEEEDKQQQQIEGWVEKAVLSGDHEGSWCQEEDWRFQGGFGPEGRTTSFPYSWQASATAEVNRANNSQGMAICPVRKEAVGKQVERKEAMEVKENTRAKQMYELKKDMLKIKSRKRRLGAGAQRVKKK